MNKILNNPKLLAISTIILLIISFIFSYLRFGVVNLLDDILDFATFGSLMLLIYFILVIFKKHINLKLINNLLFINYIVVAFIKFTYIIDIFSSINGIIPIMVLTTYLPLFIALIIFLGITFYSKRRNIIRPNLLAIMCIFLYVVCLSGSIFSLSTYGIVKAYRFLLPTLATIYFIPMILYFRLYAFNKLRKMEERKWKKIFLII